MTRPSSVYRAALAAIAVVAAVLVAADITTVVRPFVVIPFLLLVPGLAIVELIGVPDPLERFALAVAVSLALAIGISLAMLYGRFWFPAGAVIALAVLVVGLTALTHAREHKAPPGVER